MPSKHFPFHARNAFSRFLMYPRPLCHPQGIPPPRHTQHEWCDTPSRTVDALDHSLSLPLEIDLSPLDSPDTPPEHLVDAVRNLGPFLPTGCELFEQEDLKIVGIHPIDAGGFADLWVGVRKDGTKVAIKSHRCFSSLSCLPAYLVNADCCNNVFCLLKIPCRGCTRKP